MSLGGGVQVRGKGRHRVVIESGDAGIPLERVPYFTTDLRQIAIVGGLKAVNSAGLSSGRVPLRTIGVMSFILAGVLLLSAAGDVRIMRSGMPQGGRRLARHLWRMCFALFIAAGSFFSIRQRVAKILPQPLTTGPMRALPIVLLFGAMFYWLWRVRDRRMPKPA